MTHLNAGHRSLFKLRRIQHGQIRPVRRGVVHSKVMFRNLASALPEQVLLRETAERSFGILLHTVATLQHESLLRKGEANDLALAAWALVHGTAMLLAEHCLPPTVTPRSVSEMRALMSDVLVRGLGTL